MADLLEALVQLAEKTPSDRLSLGEMADAFGNRAFGPLLLLPTIITLLPIVGMIPGLSVTMATWILLVAAQMCFHEGSIWLPERLKNFSVSKDRLNWSVNKISPYLKWLDKAVKPRWSFLTGPPFTYAIALLCILLALTMYPLAFIIAGVGPPAIVILLLALGLTARDGVVVTIAFVLTGFCGWLVWYWFFT